MYTFSYAKLWQSQHRYAQGDGGEESLEDELLAKSKEEDEKKKQLLAQLELDKCCGSGSCNR